jgi:hypothetical protein
MKTGKKSAVQIAGTPTYPAYCMVRFSTPVSQGTKDTSVRTSRVATNQPTSTLRLRLVGCLCNKASGWLVGQSQVKLVGWLAGGIMA